MGKLRNETRAVEHRPYEADKQLSSRDGLQRNQPTKQPNANVAPGELLKEEQMGGPLNCTNSELDTYLQELEAGYLPTCSLDINRSLLSKSKTIREKFWNKDKPMEYSRSSLPLETSENSTEPLGEDLLTSCAEDSLVKTSAPPGPVGKESSEPSPLSGLKCSESFLKSTRKKYSSKTAVTSGLKDLDLFSKDLPTKGMMLRGVCYPLLTVVPITNVSGCGYTGEKLPTPTAHNAKEGAYPAEGKRNTPTLAWFLGGKIHPEYTEWMMGWPIGWTDLKPLGMGKYQSWLLQHTSP